MAQHLREWPKSGAFLPGTLCHRFKSKPRIKYIREQQATGLVSLLTHSLTHWPVRCLSTPVGPLWRETGFRSILTRGSGRTTDGWGPFYPTQTLPSTWIFILHFISKLENQWYGLNQRQLLYVCMYVSRGTTSPDLPKGEDKASGERTRPRPMPAPWNMVKCPILRVPCNLCTHVRLPRAFSERGSPWRIECSEYHLLE